MNHCQRGTSKYRSGVPRHRRPQTRRRDGTVPYPDTYSSTTRVLVDIDGFVELEVCEEWALQCAQGWRALCDSRVPALTRAAPLAHG